MVAKSTFCVALFTLLVSGTVSCQPRAIDKGIPVSNWVLDSTPNSVRLCVGYSIPFSRLIFIKSEHDPTEFTSALSFSVDALDSTTGMNYHGFAERDIRVRSFTESKSGADDAEDFVILTLPRSAFQIHVDIRDDAQKITYVNSTLNKSFPANDSSSIISVIFVDSASNGRYFPVHQDRVAPFPGQIRFLLISVTSAHNHLTVSLLDKDRKLAGKSESAELLARRLEPLRTANGICFSSTSDTGYSILTGTISGETLDEGNYQLQISENGETDRFPFRYVWTDKPLSLRNFDIALSLLKYIVPDSVFSEIASGSTADREKKFHSYWKSHDPTPATAYNELEAEYYERADFAANEFRTLRNANGAFTDRGKAYILFGKPESIVREFKNDGTFEIWKYPNLKKSLVFKERNFGEFELYQTEQL